jgi:hypothetical protein
MLIFFVHGPHKKICCIMKKNYKIECFKKICVILTKKFSPPFPGPTFHRYCVKFSGEHEKRNFSQLTPAYHPQFKPRIVIFTGKISDFLSFILFFSFEFCSRVFFAFRYYQQVNIKIMSYYTRNIIHVLYGTSSISKNFDQRAKKVFIILNSKI